MNKLVLTSVAAFLYACILISVPLRRRKISLLAGEVKLALKNIFPVRSIAIFAFCAILIAIIPLRSFALYLQIVFYLVSLIGAEMSARELVSYGKCGIYENMVIYDTYSILFDEIECLPTLSYEDDPETTNVDKRFLELLQKNGNRITLGFESEEIRQNVVSVILSIRPELKV